MASTRSPDTHPLSAAAPIGVLVVDDQRAVREGVAELVRSSPIPLRDVLTASNCVTARSAAALLQPELVVLDVDLAGEDGLTLIGQLGPAAHVVVLTGRGDVATRDRARQLGASAFVDKGRPAAELLAAIVAAATTHK